MHQVSFNLHWFMQCLIDIREYLCQMLTSHQQVIIHSPSEDKYVFIQNEVITSLFV